MSTAKLHGIPIAQLATRLKSLQSQYDRMMKTSGNLPTFSRLAAQIQQVEEEQKRRRKEGLI